MRITGGRIKGRTLDVPAGTGVRPTTDRARETLFNVLINRFRQPGGESVLSEARVLDAFAGTGALGIEAWSRGASSVAFVESDRNHRSTLAANLQKAKLPATEHAITSDRSGLTAPFDLILADPPYEQGAALVSALVSETALWHAETLLVWERPRGSEGSLVGWETVHETPSGKTVFAFLRPRKG